MFIFLFYSSHSHARMSRLHLSVLYILFEKVLNKTYLIKYKRSLLGVKQRSCETSIVIVGFPIIVIIRGQAAKLRVTYCNCKFSYYY